MSECKILFLDLDGTLIGRDQTIPDSALGALASAKSAGHVLIMCTGRSVPELYPHLWELGFSGAVTGAGGYVLLGDDVLVDRRLSRAHIGAVTSILTDLDALYIWQSPDEMNPSPGFMDYFIERAGIGAKDWEIYARSIAPYVRDGLPETSAKCTAYIRSGVSSIEAIRSALPAGLVVTAGSVPAGDTLVVEVTPADVSKGTGLRLVAERLGARIEDTIAFGDSMNDLEALDAAGVGVAMGGASPQLLAIADLIAPRLEDDGIARAFEALGLLG